MRGTKLRCGGLAAVALAGLLSAGAAAAQAMDATPRSREPQAGAPRAAPPARLGFGANNDAQPGGVPGNAPFNNQLRKHTDPLGANGGR